MDLYLRLIRMLTVFYMAMLVLWGATAFPLQWEMSVACKLLSIDPNIAPEAYTGFKAWIATVNQGLTNVYVHYPFLSYGYDWLAFSHLVIAVAFIGVFRKPIRNIWVVHFGMIACVGVIPLALICGHIRGIPLFHQLVDCSFGIFGIIPLLLLHKYIKKLELITGKQEYKY